MTQGITLKDIELFGCENTEALKLSFIFSNNTKYSVIMEKDIPLRDFCNDIQAIAGELRRMYVTPSYMDTSLKH
jgi:hypothetical protein